MATAGIRDYNARVAATQGPRSDAPRMLGDDEVRILNDVDAASAEEMDLMPLSAYNPADMDGDEPPMRAYRPGDTVFDFGDDAGARLGVGSGAQKAVIRGTATGTDNEPVLVFDREGHPFPMPINIAKARLKKTYGLDHPQWPGQRVFFPRPPKTPDKATIPCEYGPACKRFHSKFFTPEQAEAHFESRHPSAFRRRERMRTAEREERSIRAQEATTLLLERLAANVERGIRVTDEDFEAALEFTLPEGDVATWTKEQCIEVCERMGQKPAGRRELSLDAWRTHTAEVVEGIRGE